jgi:iron complex transport system substrate-binding protein
VLIEPRGSVAGEAASELPELGLAFARVRYDRLNDIAPLFRFLGQLLGHPQRGDALAAYAEHTLREIDGRVAKIPESRRPKVYYARGPDGLQTACGEGTQLEVTVRAGGRPALLCGFGPGRRGRRSVSLDQVIAMRPDVIFATDPAFLKTIREDWRWKAVKAVADGRVYLAPTDMGGWIDRPPLFTRLLGLTWAYDRLYQPPKKADADIAAAKAEFFKLFFHESPPK